MTSDAVLRWVRVLTLPSVLFTCALAGHAAGGGATPPPRCWFRCSCSPWSRRPRSPAPLLSPAAVGGVTCWRPGVLHAALQLLGGTAVTATTTMCGEGTGGSVSSPTSSTMMMHPDAAVSHGSAMSLMSGGHLVMLLAHLAAAVVVGVWLAAGERAFWMLLALAARPVVDAWRTVRAVARGVGAVVVSCPRLQLGWGLRCAFRGSDVDRGCRLAARPAEYSSPEPARLRRRLRRSDGGYIWFCEQAI